MTDEQITDAILRRIGDQASEDRFRVQTSRQRDGTHRLMHERRLLGSMRVENGQITLVFLDRGVTCIPAIPGHLPTEAEIDDVAAVICDAANREVSVERVAAVDVEDTASDE